MSIKDTAELHALYDPPSGRAKNKDLHALEKHAINFIKTSPFLVMSTSDVDGKMDASPRGGHPGFVKVLNENEIVIPDSKGNNRVDSMSNIIETGRVGLLFLIPGVDETLRLNGSAIISTDDDLLKLFPNEKISPKSCIVIKVEEVFLHCAKALMRSKLWHDDYKIERKSFPTMGRMLKDQLGDTKEPESQEEMVKRYQQDL